MILEAKTVSQSFSHELLEAMSLDFDFFFYIYLVCISVLEPANLTLSVHCSVSLRRDRVPEGLLRPNGF